MIIASKHSALIGRIFLTLFIVANSGFTTVVRQCTMKSSQAMECCANTNSQNSSKHQNGELVLVGTAADCHSSSIAGGLANVSAVVEKENRIHSAKTLLIAPFYCGSLFSEVFSKSSLNSLPLSSPLFPLFGEKCVLNSTFLI
jgi:hypothetical protein